ncbi:MAG: biotin synthase BioB [Deltaproteobacteria bacterium]|nr:MAG: biotin synthase BioB [Deltaproteobacteria bacterium]
MRKIIESWEEKALSGKGIDPESALHVLSTPDEYLFDLLGAAFRVRLRHKGRNVRFCSIVNAKSGLCSEDCSFCSQSRVSRAEIEKFPLIDPDEVETRARAAKESGAREFSIVTSGVGLKNWKEVEKVGEAVGRVRALGLETCVSIGIVDREVLRYLKEKGLSSFHHNLETSRSYFPNVCTTHSYEEDVRVVREAKEEGLWVCCGGIFGIGESDEDRVELAFTLKELDVDSIPLNFLNPIPGTPLEGRRELTPLTCLRIIAMMRLVNPTKEIIVCGGREVNLRDLQSLMFVAGATGTMLGNYLTTLGRPPEEDIQMVEDLNLTWTVGGSR